MDWIEQCLTYSPTQYRLYRYVGDSFYRLKDPTNSIKALKEKRYKRKPRKSKEHKILHTK